MSAIGREPGAMPVSVLDELDRWMARLGLARPSVAWAEWAIPEAWRPGLASAPAGPVSLSRDELLRLGVALLMRHPTRAAEILAAFGQWSIDLRHRRLQVIDLRVERGDGIGLRVGCEGQTSELAQVFEPKSTVVQALRARADRASEADALLLRIRLDALVGASLATAESVAWERLVDATRGVPTHLVRLVTTPLSAGARRPIERVAFVSASELPVSGAVDEASFSALERAQVARSWMGQMAPAGSMNAELAHLHMHGMGGVVRGGATPAIRSDVVVVSACDAARPGGMVPGFVRSGAALDAVGFEGLITIAEARFVARALHEELRIWARCPALGVLFAALAVRSAFGARDISHRWRHYRGAASSLGDALETAFQSPRAGVHDDSVSPSW